MADEDLTIGKDQFAKLMKVNEKEAEKVNLIITKTEITTN